MDIETVDLRGLIRAGGEPKRAHVLHAWLSAAAYEAIAAASARHGEHPDRLVARLLELIADHPQLLDQLAAATTATAKHRRAR